MIFVKNFGIQKQIQDVATQRKTILNLKERESTEIVLHEKDLLYRN